MDISAYRYTLHYDHLSAYVSLDWLILAYTHAWKISGFKCCQFPKILHLFNHNISSQSCTEMSVKSIKSIAIHKYYYFQNKLYRFSL